jgi:hypothetical protein
MNAIEDRLRAATRAVAGTVAPGSAPPLHLPGQLDTAPRGRRGPRLRADRQWPGWLAPLTAAAAVVAVVTSSLAISSAIQARRPGAGPVPGRGSVLAGLPRYYISLAGGRLGTGPYHAVVRATTTGKVIATVAPPRPYGTFTLAAGSGDGRVFVLAAGRALTRPVPTKFFLLRIGRSGGHVVRTALPIPALPADAQVSGIALTPDATKLAVALRGGTGGGPGPAIQVYTLASGRNRVWTWPGGAPVTNNNGDTGQVLSWAADGRTVAFQQWVGNSIHIRLLDTSAPGSSLRADSRLALAWPGDAESLRFVHGRASNVIDGFTALLTPDGTRIVCATVTETRTAARRPLMTELAFTEFWASTGKVARKLYSWRFYRLYPGESQWVLWTNATGSKLIVAAHPPETRPTRDPHTHNLATYRLQIGVVTGDRFTPLPGAPQPASAAPWPIW